jgi:hypothetical protein
LLTLTAHENEPDSRHSIGCLNVGSRATILQKWMSLASEGAAASRQGECRLPGIQSDQADDGFGSISSQSEQRLYGVSTDSRQGGPVPERQQSVPDRPVTRSITHEAPARNGPEISVRRSNQPTFEEHSRDSNAATAAVHGSRPIGSFRWHCRRSSLRSSPWGRMAAAMCSSAGRVSTKSGRIQTCGEQIPLDSARGATASHGAFATWRDETRVTASPAKASGRSCWSRS